MTIKDAGPIRFEEAYFERIWGGDKLRRVYGKRTPEAQVTGEAWMISDHSSHESVVSEGPFAGETLRTLLTRDAGAILGTRARLTPHGRFPLLLKLLDAAQALSVQVHPDDEAAKRLGEPDVGKTEMWHVLDADPGSELICGLASHAARETFAAAIADGTVEALMTTFPSPAGTTAFIPAGTVHAMGAGLLLAEIQQNSDITYRIYDWGRVDSNGGPRELHIDKALQVTHFGAAHSGPSRPLRKEIAGAECDVLAACRYFAAELLRASGTFSRPMDGSTFHLLLGTAGTLRVSAGSSETCLRPGEAAMIPGALDAYRVEGDGAWLDYYVPDLAGDVVRPLRAAGHSDADIVCLGGAPESSDLASELA